MFACLLAIPQTQPPSYLLQYFPYIMYTYHSLEHTDSMLTIHSRRGSHPRIQQNLTSSGSHPQPPLRLSPSPTTEALILTHHRGSHPHPTEALTLTHHWGSHPHTLLRLSPSPTTEALTLTHHRGSHPHPPPRLLPSHTNEAISLTNY